MAQVARAGCEDGVGEEERRGALEWRADCVLPRVRITDAPVLRLRGYMLDVSRNRVPLLGELKRVVDMISKLKMNALQVNEGTIILCPIYR